MVQVGWLVGGGFTRRKRRLRKSFFQVASCRALTQDMVRGFTVAECCCGQFALNGADRRGWRGGSARVVAFRRLCAGLYRLYGLPRLVNWFSRGWCHSCTSFRLQLYLGLYLCVGLRLRLSFALLLSLCLMLGQWDSLLFGLWSGWRLLFWRFWQDWGRCSHLWLDLRDNRNRWQLTKRAADSYTHTRQRSDYFLLVVDVTLGCYWQLNDI